MVQMGVGQKDVVNGPHFLERQVTQACPRIDQDALVDQEGGCPAVLGDGAGATQYADPHALHKPCSALHELHLGACQFQHVAAVQRNGLAADGVAVQRRGVAAFHVGEDETMGPLGDRGHGHAGFADGGDNFDQIHLTAGGRAREHLDVGVHGLDGRRWAWGNHAGLEDHGLLEVRVLVLVEEADLVLAHINGVAVVQRLALDSLAVHVGAVGALEVLDLDLIAPQVKHGVLAAYGKVVDDDIVVRAAAESGALLVQLDFLDDNPVDRNDHFGHDQLLIFSC